MLIAAVVLFLRGCVFFYPRSGRGEGSYCVSHTGVKPSWPVDANASVFVLRVAVEIDTFLCVEYGRESLHLSFLLEQRFVVVVAHRNRSSRLVVVDFLVHRGCHWLFPRPGRGSGGIV